MQGLSAAPKEPAYPGLQTQEDFAGLAAGEDEWAGQSEQMLLPVKEYVFTPQSSHTMSEVAATCVEFVPASHPVHAWVPLVSLYVPGRQSEHCPGPSVVLQPERYLPVGHVLMHVRQASDDSVVLYLPAAQVAQEPPEVPPQPLRYWPAGHPAQLTQEPPDSPPHPLRYWPAGHPAQLAQEPLL